MVAQGVRIHKTIFTLKIILIKSYAESKDCSYPDSDGGSSDDHPGVDAALGCKGGEGIVKHLFEEFIG